MEFLDILLIQGAVASAIVVAFIATAAVRAGLSRRIRRRAIAAVPYQQALDRHESGWSAWKPIPTEAAYAWLDTPLPEERKLALIDAGIDHRAALAPATTALDDDALRVLRTLQPEPVRALVTDDWGL